jgi:hypothetical protein
MGDRNLNKLKQDYEDYDVIFIKIIFKNFHITKINLILLIESTIRKSTPHKRKGYDHLRKKTR